MFGFSAFSELPYSTIPVAGNQVYNAAVFDTATGTDAISASRPVYVTVLESAAISEFVTGGFSYVRNISELATSFDFAFAAHAARAVVLESGTGADQVSALRTLAAATVETVSGSDSTSASTIFRGILQEIATLTDTVNAPGSTYSAPILELSTLQDAARTVATFPVAVTEAATGSQTNSAAFIPYAQITESATITDVASALAAFAVRTAESASAADAVLVAPSVFNAVALASAQAVDNANPAGSVYNATAVETATVLDSLIGGFLWNQINDDQSVTWVKVDTREVNITSYWAASAASQDAVIMLATGPSPAAYIRSTGGRAQPSSLPISSTLTSAYYINGYFYVFGTTGTANNGKLLRSVDGLNWGFVTLPLTTRPVITVFGNGTQLGVVQNGRVYISVDNGETWTGGDTGFPTFAYRTDCIWDGTKYVLTDGSRIRTSSNGLNWTTVSGPLSGYDRGCLAWDGTTYMCLRTASLGSGNQPQLRYSTNGTTWTVVSLPSGLLQATDLFVADGAFALITSGGVFYTTQAPAFTFAQQGTATNYTYSQALTPGYMVAKFKGKYYIPGIGTVEMTNKFLTTENLVAFDVNSVTAWTAADDTQSPNWQNIQTLN